jgi:hypothetical protein
MFTPVQRFRRDGQIGQAALQRLSRCLYNQQATVLGPAECILWAVNGSARFMLT